MLGEPAEEILLGLAIETLEAIDWEEDAGKIPGVIRPWRRRPASKAERAGGCLQVRFVSDGPDPEMEAHHSNWEMYCLMEIELRYDSDTATETSADDVTGIGEAGRVLKAAYVRMRQPVSILRTKASAVRLGDLVDDDDSTADKSRLIRALFVQYRVNVETLDILTVGATP